MLCTELTAIMSIGQDLKVWPLRCKRWSCDHCRPHRQIGLRRLARGGNPTTFLTLTVNPAYGPSPDWRASALVAAFRTLRRRIVKRYNLPKLEFLAVFEATKKGEPHLHVLMRSPYIPQDWISDQMRQLMAAPVVDIRWVGDQGRLAAYVSKYLGKAPHAFAGVKRYWRSQEFDQRDDETEWRIGARDCEVERRPAPFDWYVECLQLMGWQAVYDGDSAWLYAPRGGP